MPGGSVYPLPPPPPLGKDRVKLQFNLGNARQLFPVAKRLAHIMQMSGTSNVCRKLLIMLEEQRGLLSRPGKRSRRPPGDSRNKEPGPPSLLHRLSGTLTLGLVRPPGSLLLGSLPHCSLYPNRTSWTDPTPTPHLQFPPETAFFCSVSLCLSSGLLIL